LADFFYHFAQASPALRGVDTSITAASNKDATLARTALKLAPTICMFKVAVPRDPTVEDSGWLTLIIPQPVAKGYPLVDCWTRTVISCTLDLFSHPYCHHVFTVCITLQ
jgi:hypothetical protein